MKLRFLQQEPPSKGLVVDIPLTGGFTSGVIVYDETGGGFDGTAVNSPVPTYPGFDWVAANDTFIDIGTGPTSVKTISFWVNQDNIAAVETLLDLYGNDYVYTTSGVVTVVGLAGHTLYVNSVVGTTGVTTITAGEWHHIVVTDSTANDASDLDIGRIGAAFLEFGLLSDVRLYDRVLGATEVKDIYELQKYKYQT